MIVCPRCGKASNGNGSFCPHCGCNLASPVGGGSQQPSKQNQALVIVAVVLGVTAVALAAILLLMPKHPTGGGQPVSETQATTADSDKDDVSNTEAPADTVVEVPNPKVEQPEGQAVDLGDYQFIMPPEWADRVVIEDQQQGNSLVTLIKTKEGSVICTLYPATQDNGADWNPDFEPIETHTCDNGNVVEVAIGNDGCHSGYVTGGSGHACYLSIWQPIAWGTTAEEQNKATVARELEAAAAGLSTDAGDSEIATRCLEACAGRIFFY